MKLCNRILALLLCLVMLTALLPHTALAAEQDPAPSQGAAPQEETGESGQTQEDTLSLSDSFLNPLYEGQISEQALHSASPRRRAPSKNEASSPVTSIAAAGKLLREGMQKRSAQIVVDYLPAQGLLDSDELSDTVYAVFEEAFVHTGVPTQGDYLDYQWGGCSLEGTNMSGRVDGRYTKVHLVYNMSYYTSAAQEREMDTAVTSLKSELNLSGKRDSEIVAGVYRWITDHVVYDDANLDDQTYTLKFSGYAALVNRTAVCQGYAVLLYRMLLEYKIDCRVIAGESGGVGHAWNIVKLGSLYYNADSTWDAGNQDFDWYLRCPANFPGHARDAEFESAAFHAAYPMSDEDFDGTQYEWLWSKDRQKAWLRIIYDTGREDRVSAQVSMKQTDPDCTTPGKLVHTARVTVLGRNFQDVQTDALPPIGHDLTHHPAIPVDIRAQKDGRREYWECSRCGGYFADKAAAQKLSPKELVLSWEAALNDLPTPKLLRIAPVPKGLLIIWKEVPGAGSYLVYRKSGSGSWSRLGTSSSTSYLDASSKSGGKYSYTVCCLNVKGDVVSNYEEPGLSFTLAGWQKSGGDWYYFKNGAMVTNAWMKDTQGWCYLGADGKMVKNAWKKDSKGWCYLGADGRMAISKWVKDGDKWYYMNSSGYMVTGWQKVGETWYFFKDSGVMASDTWAKDSKGWCYLGADGKMVTEAWKKDSKGWCYLGADGRMTIGQWIKDGGKWYYLNASGYMATGWQKVSGKWYYMDSSGVMQTGWLKDNGKWYYLDGSGVMVTGTKTIGGKSYTFNSSGVCQNP